MFFVRHIDGFESLPVGHEEIAELQSRGTCILQRYYTFNFRMQRILEIEDDQAGIRVEFASPQGGAAPLDGLEDMKDPVIAHYWADAEFRHAIAHTRRLDDVDPSRYSALFFAGGHGTMWDFPDSAAAQKLIREIDGAGGIVSAVCSTITTASAPSGSAAPVGIATHFPCDTTAVGAAPIRTAPARSR